MSGLRLGADDFLTKDVSLPHLAARVAALFRRIDALRRPGNAAEIVRRGALVIDAREDADHLERRARGIELDGVLDRARPRQQSRPREESPAAHGCRERGAGRQHHHLAHQTAAPQIPSRSIRPSTPSRRFTAWATAGSSEHPLTTADRRIDHLDPAVGGLPVRSRARERAADGAGGRAGSERGHDRACTRRGAAAGVSRCGRHRAVLEEDGDLYVYPVARASRCSTGIARTGISRRIPRRCRARGDRRRESCSPTPTAICSSTSKSTIRMGPRRPPRSIASDPDRFDRVGSHARARGRRARHLLLRLERTRAD